MAQPTSLPEPQAGAPRTFPSVSSAVPASPTKSLWKRLLNRSASAHPEEHVKSSSAVHPASPQPVSPAVPRSDLESSFISPEASASSNPASGDLDVVDNAQLINGSNVGVSILDCDGGVASKTTSNSRRAPHRDVVPGLPRAQTFARQQSELRGNLLPIIPTPAERRGVSADRRLTRSVSSPTSSQVLPDPRTSAPNISYRPQMSDSGQAEPGIDATPEVVPPVPSISSLVATTSSSQRPIDEAGVDDTTATTSGDRDHGGAASFSHAATLSGDQGHGGLDGHSIAGEIAKEMHHVDTASMTSSQYEHRIRYELEQVWILNLSMHFRDKSRREKFFVTYRQRPDLSRRVTISLDYRNAPEGSLEMDLLDTKLQRDKNEMIYEAIRESLVDIQFYNTVTNLKLQTTDGRLHVHVVEDTTEIIDYPSNQFVQHLGCRKIRESEVEFDSHMSGFVYKVRVNGRVLIKKEIPGPDSVDEFLYEVNALNFLRDSHNVIELYGVIIGDDDRVKGLLISYAEQGALIDILYENNHGIPWHTRMKWARQIVHGLSEIHEAGFVQGDFTLSNIVIDDDGNAKIIDINRRGCPVGWEPPEATPLIQSDQRISMYIGVKSDLYQLGMVLWALATQDDDPESHGRPLHLGEDVGVPQWYRSIVENCLAEDPRERSQALQLLSYFPRLNSGLSRLDDSDYDDDWVQGPQHPTFYAHSAPSGSVDDGSNSFRLRAGGIEAGIESVPSGDENGDDVVEQFTQGERPNFAVDKFNSLTPIIRTVTPSNDWAYVNFGHTYVDPSNGVSNEPYYYPTRGRSPPREGTTSDSARRAASWERTRSAEMQSPGSNGPRNKQAGRSHSPSLPVGDPSSSSKSKDEIVDTADAAETERKESTDSNIMVLRTEDAVPVPVDDDRAEHAVLLQTETQIPVTEASASKCKDAESKEAVGSNSPECPSESYYSLGNGALPHEAPPPTTTHTLGEGDPGSNLLDQIKGVGAVYEEAYPHHLDLHDDEKKDANDDRHYRFDDELNALVTT